MTNEEVARGDVEREQVQDKVGMTDTRDAVRDPVRSQALGM